LDQTRSISVYADAAVFLYSPPPDPDVTSQNSDTDVLTGGYSNSLSANVTNPVSLYTVVGTAEQSSNVSSSGLSGSGTTSSSATAGGQFEGETSEDGNGKSTYSVDFSVAAPTPIFFSGNLSLQGNFIFPNYPIGSLDTVTGKFTLSSNTNGSLYSLSQSQGYTFPPYDISYSTVLEPGQIYTLMASASSDSPAGGATLSNPTSTASFTFTADISAPLPEPASLTAISATAALMLRRRRSQ
jgi:hypothetical protein